MSGIGHSLAKHKQVIIYPDKMKPFDQCFHFSHVNSLCRYVDLPGGCGIFAAVVDAKALGRILRVSTDVYCRYYTCYISIRHIIHVYCIYVIFAYNYTTDLFTCFPCFRLVSTHIVYSIFLFVCYSRFLFVLFVADFMLLASVASQLKI